MSQTWTDYLKPHVEEWLKHRCVAEQFAQVSARELYEAWCADMPKATVSAHAFSSVVGALGISFARHARRGRIWVGLRLL